MAKQYDMVKALILDSELFNKDALLGKIKDWFSEPLATMSHTETVASFWKELRSGSPWKMIIVNFMMEDFVGFSKQQFCSFITEIKTSQVIAPILVGVTGHSTQQRTLEKMGIPVFQKEYSLGLCNPREKKRFLTKEIIRDTVSEYFKVPSQELSTQRGKGNKSRVRQTAMYLSLIFLEGIESQKTVGVFYGGRDRTTVGYSYKKVKDLMNTDPEYCGHVMILTERLRNGTY